MDAVNEACAIADRAGAAFGAWAAAGPNARRALLAKAADALEAQKDQFVAAMMEEVGATAGWAMFNLKLAGSMTREAAAITTQIGGVGASGYGRLGGKAGIDQFTELRWITMETQPGHYPI